jgi:putative thioredoxin
VENSKFGSLPKGFGRAFDLSSLARPAQQSTPSQVASDGSIPVSEANLVPEFLDYSQRIPVLLFVWSQRAKGSEEFLALLATLAREDGGAWRLGSVSFDSDPQIAQALRVTAIPAAVAILKGQLLPIPQLPPDKASLRTLIEKILDIAKEQGMSITRQAGSPTAEPSTPTDPEEDEAYSAIERGDFESAATAYRSLLARKPGDPLATQALAQCELMVRTASYDAKKVLESAAKTPDDLELQKQASDIEVAMGQFAEGFTRLITFIKNHPSDERKIAKEHLLALFTVVPPEDPALLKARRDLASALF